MKRVLDYQKYAEKSRQLGAESCVLVRNENKALPILKDEVVSVFGRIQKDTYYCGTGSGGMVNPPYVVDLIDGIKAQRQVNEELVKIYENFIEENPFDKGAGWAQEPWCQVEMPLTLDQVKAAKKKSDIAVFMIGRSAGEDKDAAAVGGSYYLNEVEEANIKMICEEFDRTVILINAGNVIDMSFVEKYQPQAVMYTWHGGSESGNAYADVICGKVNPSGCLPDTVSVTFEDNPSTKNFGDLKRNIYQEDIFVGYRYFETFAPEKVVYPFGYGLSYTTFEMTQASLDVQTDTIKVSVKNTGDCPGKKTVQVYVEAPNGKLGKAKKVLVGFAKTKVLEPNETQELLVQVDEQYYTSYDEQGDNPNCFVLEAGTYMFHVGFDVRNTIVAGAKNLEATKVLEQCNDAMSPVVAFDVMHAIEEDGVRKISYRPVKTRTYDIAERLENSRKDIAPRKELGATFQDVCRGKVSIEDFVNQLSDLELIHISRGEGMCSPKVTPGTAGSFGAVTDALLKRGIPLACCADGPSGLRMDCGTMAFSIPNGTAIASTFNPELTNELFEFLALELVKNKIDTILGPGLNIHRNPLCGRNFEYFSEDPFLTGKMTVAELTAYHRNGVTGTMKHFACNNQENKRREADSVVSQRAIREIYLKAFEMAVKEAKAFSIMSAYNPLNGIQTASHYDLLTVVLREEWGFDGIVMTDWWAEMNFEGGPATQSNTYAMIFNQNDLFMVNGEAATNSNNDNSEEMLAQGKLQRFELVRGGINIVSALTRLNCADNYSCLDEFEVENEPEHTGRKILDAGFYVVSGKTSIPTENLDTTKGTSNQYVLEISDKGRYLMNMKLSTNATSSLAQLTLNIIANGIHMKSITLKGGTSGEYQAEFDVFTNLNTYLELYFTEGGIVVEELVIDKFAEVKQFGVHESDN